MQLMWIWIVVAVAGLIILGVAAARVLGHLGELRRAAVKLRRRQDEAMRLRAAAEDLQQTVADLERRVADLTANRK